MPAPRGVINLGQRCNAPGPTPTKRHIFVMMNQHFNAPDPPKNSGVCDAPTSIQVSKPKYTRCESQVVTWFQKLRERRGAPGFLITALPTHRRMFARTPTLCVVRTAMVCPPHAGVC